MVTKSQIILKSQERYFCSADTRRTAEDAVGRRPAATACGDLTEVGQRTSAALAKVIMLSRELLARKAAYRAAGIRGRESAPYESSVLQCSPPKIGGDGGPISRPPLLVHRETGQGQGVVFEPGPDGRDEQTRQQAPARAPRSCGAEVSDSNELGMKAEQRPHTKVDKQSPHNGGRSGTEAHDSRSVRMTDTGHQSQLSVRELARRPERRGIMGPETTTDCRFQSQCAAFKDRLISAKQKGPSRLGCTQQKDAHRAGHCKIFRCMSLAKRITEAFAEPIDATAQEEYAPVQRKRQMERAICSAS